MPPLTSPMNPPTAQTVPYIRFNQFRDGSWTRQIEYPGYESYSRGHLLGSFYEYDFNASHKNLTVFNRHDYTTQGKSTTVDWNHDEKINASTVKYVTTDAYKEHGNNQITGVGGVHIHATAGQRFIYAEQTEVAATENHVTDHNDGAHYINLSGDHVKLIGGVKYESVGSDYGIYLANGNMDTNVKGNHNINCHSNLTTSAVNHTHTSNTNRTINVGQNYNINVGQTLTVNINTAVHNGQNSISLIVGSNMFIVNTSGVFSSPIQII